MRMQCALLQRWLPGYLEGELAAFWRRRLEAHLKGCPACRQELAALKEVVAALKATPVADPGPDFWREFSRELHLKLAQAAQEAPAAPAAPAPRRFRVPYYYLLGAPALAVLVLWVASHLTQPSRMVLTQKPQPAPTLMTKAESPKAMVYVAVGEEGLTPEPEEDEEDFTSGDLEPVIADLTEQEREILLKKLRAREGDGSCGTLYFSGYSV